jgi:hypothetical protein
VVNIFWVITPALVLLLETGRQIDIVRLNIRRELTNLLAFHFARLLIEVNHKRPLVRLMMVSLFEVAVSQARYSDERILVFLDLLRFLLQCLLALGGELRDFAAALA